MRTLLLTMAAMLMTMPVRADDWDDYLGAVAQYEVTLMGAEFEVFGGMAHYQSIQPRYLGVIITAQMNQVDMTTNEWLSADSNYSIAMGDAARHIWLRPDLRWNLFMAQLLSPTGHLTLARLHAMNSNWAGSAAEYNDAAAAIWVWKAAWCERASDYSNDAEGYLVELEMLANMPPMDDPMDDPGDDPIDPTMP